MLAFVISAALAGLAGSMKSVVFQLASLNDAHWHMSGEVILMTLGPVGENIVLVEQVFADQAGNSARADRYIERKIPRVGAYCQFLGEQVDHCGDCRESRVAQGKM